MKGVDQSQMSRSATESTEVKQAAELRKSKLDIIFPLFDQMNSVVRIPGIIYKIGTLFFYLQTLTVSLWPQSPYYTSASASELSALRYFMLIFWFTDINDYVGSILPSFAAVAVVTVLTLLIIIFQLHYYSTRRSFMKWSLYLTKLFLDFVAPILIIPAAGVIATSFLLVVRNGDGIYWVYLVFGAVFYAILMAIALYSLKLNARSAVIAKCSFPVFDDTALTLYFCSSTIFMVLAAVLTTYPDWSLQICTGVHFVVEILIFIQTLVLPSHHTIDNAILSGVILSGIVMDFLMFIFYFVPETSCTIIYVLMFVLVVVFSVVMYFVLSSSIKKIKKILTNEDNMSESEKVTVFTEEKLDQNEGRALTFLRVGFTQCCDLFIDNSLVNFLIKSLRKNSSFSQLLQIVTYFPSEQRSVNVLFKLLHLKRDLTFPERFLIYQVQRIKTLRASHSSLSATELLLELHTANEQCEANINSFWSSTSPSICFCETRNHELDKTSLLWLEAIDTYPNNPKMSYEYSRFLVECVTNFELAIFHHQKAELIEGGRSFAVDTSFRSFVREFPAYLKKGIVNVKGKKMTKAMQQEQQQNNNQTISMSSNSSGSNGSSSFGSTNAFTVDAEMEDLVGKKILKNSRMRMTLYHALEGRKSHTKKFVYISEAIIFLVIIAVFLVYYILMITTYANRQNSVINIARMKNLRFYQNNILYIYLTRFASLNGYLNLSGLIFDEDGQEFEQFISFDQGYIAQVLDRVATLKSNAIELFNNLAELASQGEDVYEIAQSFLQQASYTDYCYNSDFASNRKVSFIDKYTYMIYLDVDMTTIPDADMKNLYSGVNDMCESINNLESMSADATKIIQGFYRYTKNTGIELNDLLTTIQNFIIYVIIVLTFVPMLLSNIGYILEVRKVLKLMLNLPDEVKKQATQQIGTKTEDTNNLTPKASNTISYSIIYLICYFVVTAVVAALSYWFLDKMISTNEKIKNYSAWYLQSVRRLDSSSDLGFSALQVVIFEGDGVKSNFTSYDDVVTKSETFKTTLAEANTNVMQGFAEAPACYGYDDVIDELHLSQRCDISSDQSSLHDVYRCSSAIQQLAVFMDYVAEILVNASQFDHMLSADIPINMIHLLSDHLWDTFNQVCVRFTTLVDTTYTDLKNESLILLIVSCVISVITLFLTFYYCIYIDNTYTFVISLIKHIPPLQLITAKNLMDFLLNRKTADDSKSMNISQAIIHNSSDAILCTNLNGIIEIINPTVTNILGYTPDQLLGQQITTFFTPESADEVNKQVALMANGQSGAVYEKGFKCLSDSGSEVNFHTTIIGMKAEGSTDISSFVFILTDETELLKQQKEAEEAKAKSEKLLYQILPKDVVRRLNSGEKDITYTIPHATVIFIDIVKFSEYSSNLTPQEIMRNLSLVFARFDETIAKYPSMIKIKLIGDVYMAAGGLFGKPEDPPNYHAEETVKFGLECITQMEEINVKLNSSLEVRVGVNTGGPLLGGILGTDKPVFDIIGDTINVASRLQSTDIPCHVQISKATQELLDPSQFSIEERGEVFLKGKGKQMTYLVTPGMTIMHMGSSFTISSTQSNQQVNPPANPPA